MYFNKASFCVSYLVLDHIIPGLSAQSIPNDELKDIEREVGNDAEDPNDSGPSPSDALDASEFPSCIHSNDSSNLQLAITNL